MEAYHEGVLDGEIGRNAGKGEDSTRIRRNSQAERARLREYKETVEMPAEPAPGGKGWDVDHVIEFQHKLPDTPPSPLEYQDAVANRAEGAASWALNKGPQGVPAGGVAKESEAGRWYNSEFFRGASSVAGSVLTGLAVVKSIDAVVAAAETDISDGTKGGQAAKAIAVEAGGWAVALAVAPEAAAAGAICGPAAPICIPAFGFIGGAAGYLGGASVASSAVDAGNWIVGKWQK